MLVISLELKLLRSSGSSNESLMLGREPNSQPVKSSSPQPSQSYEAAVEGRRGCRQHQPTKGFKRVTVRRHNTDDVQEPER